MKLYVNTNTYAAEKDPRWLEGTLSKDVGVGMKSLRKLPCFFQQEVLKNASVCVELTI